MSGELGEHTDSTGSGRFGPGLVPILGWLRSYDRRWLRGDLIAGMTVAALIVPKNLGYAEIAGIPVQNGLYAAAATIRSTSIRSRSRKPSRTLEPGFFRYARIDQSVGELT